jgi:hypothetical protein
VQLRIQQMVLRKLFSNLRSCCWVCLFFISSGSFAKELNCSADQGENSKGWIPSQFLLDIADDREVIRVLNPRLDIFGSKDFEKAFIGSSYWARGKGKSRSGEYYNFQLQLDLSDDDSRYKIKLIQQGFHDLNMKGSCRSGSPIASNDAIHAQSTAVTDQQCLKIFGFAEKGVSTTFYAKLKLRLVDPQVALKELDSSPVLEACINKFREGFPTIRSFIQDGKWKSPLSASDCKIIDYEKRFGVMKTLASMDEKYQKESWEGSPHKAIYEWCSSIFK